MIYIQHTKFGKRSLYLLIILILFSFACSKRKAAVKKYSEDVKPKVENRVTEKQAEPPLPLPVETTTDKAASKFPAEDTSSDILTSEQVLNAKIAEAQKFLGDIYFDYNKYTLTDNAKVQLNNNAKYLLANSDISIQIEGHCDERGSDEYNLALGEKRAVSAKSYLESSGIRSNRISWISYGEEKPLDRSHNESAWSKNRRTHFLVTSVK